MKRIIPVLLIICICLTFGGCSSEKETGIRGSEQVEKLRSEAAGWESGRYLFTDLETGETNQAFSFMYNGDSLIYLYEKVMDGSYYAEYFSGGMIYIIDGEDLSVINEGVAGYSREAPHPYASGELLFYVKEYISGSEEIPLEQDAVTYVHNYDTAGMNQAIGTSLTDFSVSYTFDSEGNFLYFTQSSFDGENGSAYMIETVDVNSVTEIENPAMG